MIIDCLPDFQGNIIVNINVVSASETQVSNPSFFSRITRTAMIDLSFLPAGQKYTATIYADAKDAHYRNNPQAYTITTKTVTSKSKLRLFTAAGGGCAIKIVPKQ